MYELTNISTFRMSQHSCNKQPVTLIRLHFGNQPYLSWLRLKEVNYLYTRQFSKL